MGKVIFLMIIIFTSGKCYAQQDIVYVKEQKGIYKRIVYNGGIGAFDTFIIELFKDQTFNLSKKGVEASGLHMTGHWESKHNTVVLINRYPSDKFLKIQVLPITDSCNEYFPDLLDSKGLATFKYFMNANNYTYSSGGIIPYKELDSLRGNVRICSNGGNYCSDVFAIPYEKCYKILIDMDLENPDNYNSYTKKIYFKKQRNRLKYIKAEEVGTGN